MRTFELLLLILRAFKITIFKLRNLRASSEAEISFLIYYDEIIFFVTGVFVN